MIRVVILGGRFWAGTFGRAVLGRPIRFPFGQFGHTIIGEREKGDGVKKEGGGPIFWVILTII